MQELVQRVCTALLIGAGETIELVVRHLRAQGLSRLVIANRSLDRAQELAAEFQGFAITLDAIAARVGYDLRNRMYDHIQYLPFTYHDHAQSGQLISRCIEDVRSIERFAGGSVAELVRFFILAFGVLAIMLADNARLAIIALLPIIPLIIMTSQFGTKIGKLFFDVDQAIGEVRSESVEPAVIEQAAATVPGITVEIRRLLLATAMTPLPGNAPLVEALQRHGGKKVATARELGIDKNTLRRKIKRFGLKPPDQDGPPS